MHVTNCSKKLDNFTLMQANLQLPSASACGMKLLLSCIAGSDAVPAAPDMAAWVTSEVVPTGTEPVAGELCVGVQDLNMDIAVGDHCQPGCLLRVVHHLRHSAL